MDLDDVLGAQMDGVRLAKQPEEKLVALMVAAKESGMEVKNIFKYFDKDDDGEISKKEFAAALDTLDAGCAAHGHRSAVSWSRLVASSPSVVVRRRRVPCASASGLWAV